MESKKRTILVVCFLVLFCCLIVILGIMYIYTRAPESVIDNPIKNDTEKQAILPKVESLEKLKELIENGQGNETNIYKGIAREGAGAFSLNEQTATGTNESMVTDTASSVSSDYHKTNVQVTGVDEADIIKTDGKYIYYVSTNKIVIVDAQNPNDLKIASEIKYVNDEKENFTPQELYISENRLIVIGNKYTYNDNNTNLNSSSTASDENYTDAMIYPYISGSNYTVAICYDTTDKTNINHLRNVEIEGYYVSSRMINNDVYIVSNKSVYLYYILNDQIDPRPLYKDTVISSEGIAIDYKDMYYFPDSECNNYLLIAGFNVNNNEEADIQTYLGAGNTIYSSAENMYIVRTKYNYPVYTDAAVTTDIIESYEVNTEIYKFSLQQGKTEFKCKGSVSGSVLNQFSMDENKGYFRIATTNNSGWTSENSANNLYILDKDLKTVGILEGLAKGERIYSVRFMGDRAYIVTFKQVDPLFVIDVSNPNNPEVLGELKIPGFSEYLHPYSENLLIGIGQDAETINEYYGERTITTGMKMALFDVSDANNPKELFSTKIGGRGTYSEILNNHKALLFSKEKDILAFPISITQSGNSTEYGKLTFQGAIVYGIDLQNGFVEKGRISHVDLVNNQSYFNYDYYKQVERIIYIEDVLFTASKKLIKSVNINNMEELNSLEIEIEQGNNMPYIDVAR